MSQSGLLLDGSLENDDPRWLIRIILVLVFGSGIVFLLQSLLHPNPFVDGLLVTDTLVIAGTLDRIPLDVTQALDLDSTWPVGLLPYRFIWQINPHLVIALNWLYLVCTAINVHYTLRNARPSVYRAALCGVALNPYLFLVASAPNKEIPLLFWTSLFFLFFLSKSGVGLLAAIAIAVVVIFVRDGYGLLLVGLVLFAIVFRRSSALIPLILFVALLVGAAFTPLMGDAVGPLRRNLEVAQDVFGESGEHTASGLTAFSIDALDNPALSSIAFAARVIGTVASLSIRPQFFTTDGGIHLLGLAYWIYGTFVLVGFIGIVNVLLTYRQSTTEADMTAYRMAVATAFLIVGISFSVFLQPRYAMPFFPYLVALIGMLPTKDNLAILLAILALALVALGLVGMDIYPGPAMRIFEKPSFLL